MADLATLQTRLADAETALDTLVKGGQVVEVATASGKRVKYASANRGDLEAYIGRLTRDIALLEIEATGSRPRRRFIPVAFS